MASLKRRTLTIDLDKLNFIFMGVTLVLAFVVGVLWQRVTALEENGVVTAPKVGTVPTQAAPSRLDDLPALAKAVGVDKGKFESCVKENRYADFVENQYQGGVKAGVTGTPSNFIMNNKGEVWSVPGAVPYEGLKAVVDAALGLTDGTAATGKLDAAKVASVPKVTKDDHILGELSDSVYLVEYSDFQCPFCKSFHPTAKRIVEENDKVAWVFRHFPLDSIHPLARPAAVASECVAEIGGNEAFWKFTDGVFAD